MKIAIGLLLAAVPASAAGLDMKAAAECMGFSFIANKPDVAASVKRLVTADGDIKMFAAATEAYKEKIRQLAAKGQHSASEVLVSEGQVGCKAIGVM